MEVVLKQQRVLAGRAQGQSGGNIAGRVRGSPQTSNFHCEHTRKFSKSPTQLESVFSASQTG